MPAGSVSQNSVQAIDGRLRSPETMLFRPSEYTAALIQALRAKPELASGSSALEIGFGSGIVLAVIGELGAASLCGVETEEMAVASGTRLLHQLGFGDRLEIHLGNMWQPMAGRRFELIVANLPQFPTHTIDYGDRLPSWSVGGHDGRQVLDRFLDGLPAHLAPGGCAVITHNGFIGIAATRERVERHGLSLTIAATVTVNLPPEKLRLMPEAIFRSENGRSIHNYGPYAFAEVHIVEIGQKGRIVG
jgi:release factor glutamine methyltransferase